MKTTNFKSIFFKAEPFIFLLVVCANLYPLFAGSYFPFMDGPAHIYNAGLIKELFQGDTFITEYIRFNPVFVPNSISYIITTPLLYFFSPNLAEKIFLLSYFIGLPFAFRYCVGIINKEQKYTSFLIIPFTYNFLMMISFYNFCMGFVFMFLTIGFFYKHIITENTKWQHYLILFTLLLLAYCCHIVVFGLTLLSVLFIYIWFLIKQFNFSIGRWFNKKTYLLVFISLPVLYLSWVYFKTIHAAPGQLLYLKNKELFDFFITARFFTIFNGEKEDMHAYFLAVFYISTFFICIYSFLQNASVSILKNNKIYFLMLVLFTLVLYKLLPDSDGLAGYVSIRLCLLTFLLSVLYIVSSHLSDKFLIPLCVLIIYINFSRLSYYKEVIKDGNNIANQLIEQAKQIEPNSFVMHSRYDDNWLAGHYSNYLGLHKNIICLENYECSLPWFPLEWKNKEAIIAIKDNLSEFKNLDAVKKQLHNKPIYYFVTGDLNAKTDSTAIKFKQALTANCVLVNSNGFANLYKLK